MLKAQDKTPTFDLAARSVNTIAHHMRDPANVSFGDCVDAEVQLLQAHMRSGAMSPDAVRRAESTILSLRRGQREFGERKRVIGG